ncbi:MAG: electron transfer flavoprotein subunit beta/FixA family protein [Gammaproteobacteria bacterium]|nr:electron transfer flavoprotein subunit beta/FixA family protein [Gammaproteobacteria bacterium]
MKIVVCVKQIQNPEIAQSVFRVDEEAKRVIPVPGLPPVISPFDEQAVEAALRIRDAAGADSDTEITVVTIGPKGARAVIKAALALGADNAVLLSDPAFDESGGYATARTLAETIRAIGDVDLILAGRQAADWDAGVVGAGIAELLGVPAITFARAVRVADGTVTVERVLEDGTETVEADLPAVVTISNELGAVRYASMRETMRAANTPTREWAPGYWGLHVANGGRVPARRVLERLYIPVNDIECEFIDGDTSTELAAALARRLREADLV